MDRLCWVMRSYLFSWHLAPLCDLSFLHIEFVNAPFAHAVDIALRHLHDFPPRFCQVLDIVFRLACRNKRFLKSNCCKPSLDLGGNCYHGKYFHVSPVEPKPPAPRSDSSSWSVSSQTKYQTGLRAI